MINIFVVETDDKCRSDEKYISSFIKTIYSKNSIKNHYVYMNGKGSFSDSKVRKNINKCIENYIRVNYMKLEENKKLSFDKLLTKYRNEYNIFFCIDIDSPKEAQSYHANIELNERIFKYVKEKECELIWFYEDIEDTFLGKKISNSDKKKESDKFLARCNINSFNLNNLNEKKLIYNNHKSNIKYVLDKYYIASKI